MKALITSEWNKYIEQFDNSKSDIYYYEEYVKLYEDNCGKALCAVCLEDNHILLMPFIRKEIKGFYDFETPYGYGGPISNYDNHEWIEMALCEMKELFYRENYVCGFVRFHSLIENVKCCQNNMQTIFDRNTVAIITNQSKEEIWANQITSKNRNMIRKAEKSGLEYTTEYDFASLDEFVALYNATMDRLNADAFYYFGREYYESFVEKLKGKAFLGTVRTNGELICAALFMYSGDYGHYHLEGSNKEYSSLAANNLLLWKAALELGKLGVKEFHLGGGYNSEPDNSLLKFKKSFSNNIKEFHIGKWIFNEIIYKELKEEWGRNNPKKLEQYGKYLLCYRY